MKILPLLAALSLALPAAAAAQGPDPDPRLSLSPRVGAGWNLAAPLVEVGAALVYDLPGGLSPRVGVAGQLVPAGCAGWCDVFPVMLAAGADYGWGRWGRRLSLGVGGGVYRFRPGGPGGPGSVEDRTLLEAVAGAERGGWRVDARVRAIEGPEHSSGDFQFVFSLGRRYGLR